ncbi:unnamed protein product [Prorocentrum cordatum]|uniref:Uncharacterized protein n=1 Tax=Prorocentrum cordatum TaxID=2364126 RepID=A0ABN9WVV3_9DINO|nr:unnamed protein product [Polarella glacialis]
MESVVARVDGLAQSERFDAAEHLELGRHLREADAQWRGNLLRMRHADDFQTRELYSFTEAHLRHLGISIAQVEGFADWQVGVLQSLGSGQPPPPPPADPASEEARHLQGVLESCRLGGPQAMLFDASPRAGASQVAQSPVVQEELARLEADHRALIDMGQCYGTFDAAGKKIFLDQVGSIQDRWKVYLARFRLNGEADSAPGYVGDAKKQIKRLGLSAELVESLLASAHGALREDADRS